MIHLIYRTTGDPLAPVDQWDLAKDRVAPPRLPLPAATIAAAPEERYLWDSGLAFGDWLEAGATLVALTASGSHQMRRSWAPVRRWRSCAARSSGVSTGVRSGRCSRTEATGTLVTVASG